MTRQVGATVDQRDIERMVTVASCASRVDAEMRRGALESAGYRAIVLTDDAGGVHPELTALTCGAVRIQVPDHQADGARDLLEELAAGVHALDEPGAHEHIHAPPPSRGGLWAVALLLVTFAAGRLAWGVWQALS